MESWDQQWTYGTFKGKASYKKVVKYTLEGNTYLSLDKQSLYRSRHKTVFFFNFRVHVSSIQSLVDRTSWKLYVMDGEDKYWSFTQGGHLRNFTKHMDENVGSILSLDGEYYT